LGGVDSFKCLPGLLAGVGGIKKRKAVDIVKDVDEAVGHLDRHAAEAGLSVSDVHRIETTFHRNLL
jgi:hypothetical protein